jgi:outer membrane murein-binding lipoprotein Lpp
MNASPPLFPQVPNIVRVIALALGAGLLSGCVGNPFANAKIDPASPVAEEVARMTRADAKLPSFASIPAAPSDVRPPASYGLAAASLDAAAAELIRDTGPETWTLQATDAFAETARRDVGPELPPVIPGDSEAFARELRERATPPPPR